MKIKDFMKLCGDKGECVILYNCDTDDGITIRVEHLFDVDRLPHADVYNIKEEYAEIMEADIASWEYVCGILCIYYFL